MAECCLLKLHNDAWFLLPTIGAFCGKNFQPVKPLRLKPYQIEVVHSQFKGYNTSFLVPRLRLNQTS